MDILKTYLKFISKSFQKEFAYRIEFFMGILNGLLFIFIFTSLWKAIYSSPLSASLGSAFNVHTIIAYAVFAMILKISFTMDDELTIQRVRTGDIAMFLIKPFNYFLMNLSECIGQSLFHFFARGIPLIVLSITIFNINLPADKETYLLFIPSAILGYTIFFIVNFIIGLLSFWFIEVFSFQLMKYGMFVLFSGGMLPIDFFPNAMQPLISFLPFKYTLYVPTSIFINHFSRDLIFSQILMQLVWVISLYLISIIMWKAAEKKLVIQGG